VNMEEWGGWGGRDGRCGGAVDGEAGGRAFGGSRLRGKKG
jgi:hypothetical protein